jgi:FKBP12-rapamycin complex-associated protein
MRQLILDKYDHICNIVLKIAHNHACARNPHIQKALLLVLPKLAAFQRDHFVSQYLVQTVAYVEKLLQGKDHRYNAYLAVGILAMATGAEMQPYLRNVMLSIRHALPAKDHPNKRRNPSLDPAIFACISMLARAVKDTIKHEMASMLEAMLNVGLSPSLTTALYELAAHIPAFKKDIAEGLLKILSLILMQQPFRHPGTPRQLLSPVHSLATSVGAGSGEPSAQDSASVVLALRTLGAFDFEGHSLLQFVRHCAENYLHSEDKLGEKNFKSKVK